MTTPRLNHRLTLETAVSAADGAGGYVETWSALGTLWAEIRPRAGREGTAEGGVLSLAGYKIIVRAAPEGHSSRPQAGQRFRQNQRVFQIQAVTELSTDARYLVCLAQEENVA